MSYTPKTWQCGEKITAEALNRLEQAIAELSDCCESGGSEPLTVSISHDEATDSDVMDKTWQQIADAFPNVRVLGGDLPSYGYVMVKSVDAIALSEESTDYTVTVDDSLLTTYVTDNANGYPTYEYGH